MGHKKARRTRAGACCTLASMPGTDWGGSSVLWRESWEVVPGPTRRMPQIWKRMHSRHTEQCEKRLGSAFGWCGQVLVFPLKQHIHQGIKWQRKQERKSVREGTGYCARDWFYRKWEVMGAKWAGERVLWELYAAGAYFGLWCGADWGQFRAAGEGQWGLVLRQCNPGPGLQVVGPEDSGREEEVSGF